MTELFFFPFISWWSFVFASDLQAVGTGWQSVHRVGAPFALQL